MSHDPVLPHAPADLSLIPPDVQSHEPLDLVTVVAAEIDDTFLYLDAEIGGALAQMRRAADDLVDGLIRLALALDQMERGQAYRSHGFESFDVYVRVRHMMSRPTAWNYIRTIRELGEHECRALFISEGRKRTFLLARIKHLDMTVWEELLSLAEGTSLYATIPTCVLDETITRLERERADAEQRAAESLDKLHATHQHIRQLDRAMDLMKADNQKLGETVDQLELAQTEAVLHTRSMAVGGQTTEIPAPASVSIVPHPDGADTHLLLEAIRQPTVSLLTTVLQECARALRALPPRTSMAVAQDQALYRAARDLILVIQERYYPNPSSDT